MSNDLKQIRMSFIDTVTRAVAITAISQYRAFESITAEECNNRSNRDISFFFFFFFFFFKVMPFSFYT